MKDVRERLADMRRSRRPRYGDGTIYARERPLARIAALLEVPLQEATTAGLISQGLDLSVVVDPTCHRL